MTILISYDYIILYKEYIISHSLMIILTIYDYII